MRTIIKNYIIGAIFLLIGAISVAQDIHFSQFYNIPLVVNPAMTGAFNGDQRVAINYKDQWKFKDSWTNSANAAYKTFAFSFDMGFLKKKWDKGYLGAGLLAYKDVAGNTKLSTTQISLSLSSFVNLGEKNSVSAGLQGGLQQKSMTVAGQSWDSQYDPSKPNGWNEGLGNNENTAGYSDVNFGDFTGGLQWTYSATDATLSSNDRKSINAGVAFHHINKPSQKFYDPSQTNIQELDKLHSRIAAHAGAFIGIKNFHLGLIPSVLFLKQGTAQEINFGTMIRYTIKEESKFTGIFKETAVSLGGYFRAKDAFIPSLQIEYASWAMGITYDVNTSLLRNTTSGKGGLELSLRYINPNPFKGGTTKSVRFL